MFVLRIIRDESGELANPSVEETTEAFIYKKILNQSYSTKETDIYKEKRKAQKSEISKLKKKQETQALECLVT